MKKINKGLKKLNSDVFTSKATQYSLLAGAFLLAVPACDDDDDDPYPESTLAYTDVDPDLVILTGAIDSIDINNDGVFDFGFAGYAIPYTFTYGGFPLAGTIGILGVNPLNGGEVAGSVQSPSAIGEIYTPYNLAAGDTVDENLQWNSAVETGQVMNVKVNIDGFGTVASYGNWTGQQIDKFLGLKVYDSGETHFGWARLDTESDLSNQSITIKDYAYESVADSPVITELIMRSSINSDQVNIYTFDKTLQVNSKTKNGNVKILKNGKEVLKSVLKNHNFKTTLNKATGLHTIEITINGKTIKKEVKF